MWCYRQCGVLSPCLFSLYVDDIIRTLRVSGYGIYVGSIFAGCIRYAYDILLLFYSGLQKMINICYDHGLCWDIKFNPAKRQSISFVECYSP